jgi:hypothetical protein
MNDFEEIGHSGGKLKINIQGTRAKFEIIHGNMNACRIESVSIPFGDSNLPIFMISDKEGYFGATCKVCDMRFRTSGFSEITTCPYCGTKDVFLNFFTINQKKYIEAYIKKFLELFRSGVSGTIDFDSLIEHLDTNTSFIYNEERQQTLFKCLNCSNTNDIIGIYGYCSSCGMRNNLAIYTEKLTLEMNRIIKPKYDKNEQYLREKEWQEVLKSSIAIFEGFSKDVLKELLKLPMDPIKRKSISGISFQRIMQAREILLNKSGFDIFGDINNDEINFINKSFNIRHLFTHNEGIVDEGYIRNTGDGSLKKGQLVRVRSNDVKRLIEILTTVGKKLAFEVNAVDI